MKRIQFILAVTGVMILASCSNYNSFNKRKFTKGVFHSNSGRLKVEKGQNKQLEQALAIEKQAATASRGFTVEEKIVSEEHFGSFQEEETIKPVETGVTLRKGRVDREQVEETSENFSVKKREGRKVNRKADEENGKKRSKKERKQLTDAQINARRTLTLGIVALGVMLLIYMFVLFAAFSGVFISFFGLMRIPALLGLMGIYKGSFFYKSDAPLEGKYKKFRRKGLSISVLTVLLWLMLFFF